MAVSGFSYREQLARAAEIAMREWATARDSVRQAQRRGGDCVRHLDGILDELRQDRECADVLPPLNKLRASIGGQVAAGLQNLERDLQAKHDVLGTFTVGLLGRTEAGKSTLREALTGGDGSTIGKGAGRTTRDVHLYEWNQIRVIDTPGFAAYQGEGDERLALSEVGRSDLTLFLVSSDGLQLDVFKFFARIVDRDRPVFIVLNCKKDIEREVHLKRFLRHPGTVFDPQELEGHRRQIDRWCEEYMGCHSVPLFPIHARAAFLAGQSRFAEVSNRLRELSRLHVLQEAIEREVARRGPVLRLRTVLGDTARGIEEVRGLCLDQTREVRPTARATQGKKEQLKAWFERFACHQREEIHAEVKSAFAPLLGSVSSFVDDHIQDRDFGRQWKCHAEGFRIDGKVKELTARIRNEAAAELDEFARQITTELKILGKLQLESEDLQGVEFTDYRRGFGRAAAWMGAGSAIALLFAVPGGGILAIGALIFTFSSWFFGDPAAKVRAAKRDKAAELRRLIERQQQQATDKALRWFEEQIVRGLRRPCVVNAAALSRRLFQCLDAVNEFAEDLCGIAGDLNRRLVEVLLHLPDAQAGIVEVRQAARAPGIGCKVLLSGSRRDLDWARDRLKSCLEERVAVVSASDPLDVQLAQALLGQDTGAEVVQHMRDSLRVRVRDELRGLAIGRKGTNLRLAERLLGIHIELDGSIPNRQIR